MERNITLVLVLGAIITLVLLFVNSYLAVIAAILVITLLMSMMIMQDTTGHPDIAVRLRDDARAIILTNKGNAPAKTVHCALIPMNIEFDVPSIGVDADYEYPFPSMVEEVKVAITFKNEAGNLFSKNAKLSSLEEEPDLLKPMIPVFKWKK